MEPHTTDHVYLTLSKQKCCKMKEITKFTTYYISNTKNISGSCFQKTYSTCMYSTMPETNNAAVKIIPKEKFDHHNYDEVVMFLSKIIWATIALTSCKHVVRSLAQKQESAQVRPSMTKKYLRQPSRRNILIRGDEICSRIEDWIVFLTFQKNFRLHSETLS